MKKVKVDIKNLIKEAKAVELEIAGTKIQVRGFLTCDEKIRIASDILANIITVSDESELVSRLSSDFVVNFYYKVKYYTNLDVEDFTAAEVYDFFVSNNKYYDFLDIVADDARFVDRIVEEMYRKIKERSDYEKSVGYNVMKTFGSILNGEDITETLAKSQEVGEEMIRLVGELKGRNDTHTPLPGGVVLDFKRKDND